MRAGVPVCPRHDEPLRNIGPKAPAVPLAVLVDGVVRIRFVVRAGRPVTVGRSPDDPEGIRIGPWLSGDTAQMVSRNHVRIELRDDVLMLSDMSTNGTVVRSRPLPFAAGRRGASERAARPIRCSRGTRSSSTTESSLARADGT